MTRPTPVSTLPRSLRDGLDGLADIGRFRLDGEWTWVAEDNRFAVRCAAELSVAPSEHMPEVTRWMLLVSPDYPKGGISFHPAAEGGITATFPHQTYNGKPRGRRPWRTGNVCIGGPEFGDTSAPTNAEDRLRWHVFRLLAWIDAAASGTLLAPGHPMEFPAHPEPDQTTGFVVFSEEPGTFGTWRDRLPGGGLVTLVNPAGMPGVWAVDLFRDPHGQPIRRTNWGLRMAGAKGAKPMEGMWFALPSPPTVPPWALPATWGEMEDAFLRAGAVSVFNSIIESAKQFRTGRRHPVLIGFPTAERIGEEPVRVHWLAAWMPVLSHGAVTAKGFRTNERGYRQRDRSLIHRDAAVEWMPTENWAPDQLTTRGTGLDRDAASRPMLMLGAGALGSVVGTGLARAGASDIAVMDREVLSGGNLVRHELGVGDVGHNKAERLARRMNDVNPHATIIGIPALFPIGVEGRHVDRVRESRAVIDCTGSDRVLDDLAAFDWGGVEDRWFISLSLGWGARRLFCFAAKGPWFPVEHFKECHGAWREREEAARKELGEPLWEGVGCWHPVFPATGTDVAAMGMVAVRFIAKVLAGSTPERVFEVYTEQGNALVSEED